MLKKIAAVAGGVFIGLVIAFARAGAFPFWGFRVRRFHAAGGCAASTSRSRPRRFPAPPVPGVHVAPPAEPAAAQYSRPNEKVGVVTSFAPLVKRMIPAVVSVNVVQDVKVSGSPFGIPAGPGEGDDEGGGGDDNGLNGGGAKEPACLREVAGRSLRAVPALLRSAAPITNSMAWARA